MFRTTAMAYPVLIASEVIVLQVHSSKDVCMQVIRLTQDLIFSWRHIRFIQKYSYSSGKILHINELNLMSLIVPSCMVPLSPGIIHCDFHDSNIILLPASTPQHFIHKFGIIDFGDCVNSFYAFDLAISVAYFMMICTKGDFVQSGSHVMAGYLSQRSLTGMEQKAIYLMVCAAYCRELILCTKDHKDQGSTNEYLLTSMQNGWPQLRHLWYETKASGFYDCCNKVLSLNNLPCLKLPLWHIGNLRFNLWYNVWFLLSDMSVTELCFAWLDLNLSWVIPSHSCFQLRYRTVFSNLFFLRCFSWIVFLPPDTQIFSAWLCCPYFHDEMN